MRSRVAVATAVSRGLSVVAGVLALAGAQCVVGQGVASATTSGVRAAAVLRESVDFGLTGAVGMAAVLVGAVGLVFGLTRHRRKSVARRAAERAASSAAARSRA